MRTARPRAALAVVAAALAAGALPPAASEAVVPPRNCGTMEVGSKVWQVKADQLRCRRARRYARGYLVSREVPSPYRCRRGPRGSSLFAQCSATAYQPDRVFYIIRRSG